MPKLNCWEYNRCGREPGGRNVLEHGPCPAATLQELDGVNDGRNGGRACWALTSTLCHGKIQGNLADKLTQCLECAFRQQVVLEEQVDFKSSKYILSILQSNGLFHHASLKCQPPSPVCANAGS